MEGARSAGFSPSMRQTAVNAAEGSSGGAVSDHSSVVAGTNSRTLDSATSPMRRIEAQVWPVGCCLSSPITSSRSPADRHQAPAQPSATTSTRTPRVIGRHPSG